MWLSRLRTVVPVALLAVLVGGMGWRSASSLAAGEAKAENPKPMIALPKDPEAVVISYDPGAGGFIRKGPPPYLRIQADGQLTVTNVHDGAKKQSKLTAKQVQDLLQFIVQDNDFFKVTAARMDDAIKTEAGKGPFLAVGGAGTSVISVQANDKKHEVSFRAASSYFRVYPKAKVLGQFVAVEKRLSDLALSVAKAK